MLGWIEAKFLPAPRRYKQMKVRRKHEKKLTSEMQGGCLGYESAPAAQLKITEGKMRFLSKGFIYRTGVRIKDFGERIRHIHIRRFFIFSLISGLVISLGLAIKESVFNCPVSEL